MLYSCSKYVQSLVNGLPMPDGVPGPLTAWITPPAIEKIDAPRAHVWGGTLHASRQTAPRGMGFKKFPWVVDVWLVYLTTADDALQNEPFAKVIDAVMTEFMTATMPVWISSEGVPAGPTASSPTDTQIQAIGETFDLSYPPEKMPLNQRQVWYSCRLGIDVLEVVQA